MILPDAKKVKKKFRTFSFLLKYYLFSITLCQLSFPNILINKSTPLAHHSAPYIWSVFPLKWNWTTPIKEEVMVKAFCIYIFLHIAAGDLYMHFSQCSYYRLKTGVKSAAELVLTAPLPPPFLRVAWMRVPCQHQNPQIRRVLNDLELPGHHSVGYHGGGLHRGIVPVKPLFTGCYRWHLLLPKPQESSEGLNDVLGINHCPPWHVVGLDKASTIYFYP